MNKILKIIVLLNIFILILIAQDQNLPIIKVENSKHQFGLVHQNAILEHQFKVQNTGNDTLKILKVRPG